MEIALNDGNLRYSGRIDRHDPLRPEWVFPATSLYFRYSGGGAALPVANRRVCWDNYVGAIVDGRQKCWRLQPRGDTRICLTEDDGCHEVLFFKRMDSCHELMLKKLSLSPGSRLLPPGPPFERRMEVYGDSVSAGEVSEAVTCVGRPDPEHNGEYSNSWYSYAWMAARKLGAELHDIAQGGIPLLQGAGYVAPPVYPGIMDIWDKVHYHPELGPVTDWDFENYTPHVVLVAVGQNDGHPVDYMKEDPEGEAAVRWRGAYRDFLTGIRGKYPHALILAATTILRHDPGWDEAIDRVCREINDPRLRHFCYRRNGAGTPGHIRIPEAEEMADELVDYIGGLNIPVWHGASAVYPLRRSYNAGVENYFL